MFIRKITINVLTPLLIFAVFPFYAVASALGATAPGVNVLSLPTPVITGIDAKNSIVQLKADGYINDNAELLVTVALVKENGDVVDVAEKKVSDPNNIRVSLHLEQIKVGDSIYAKFVNHGIGGDEADRTHEAAEPEPEPDATAPPTQIIIERGGGSSSTSYIVTQADPVQVIVEKLIEVEPELEAVIPEVIIKSNPIPSSTTVTNTDGEEKKEVVPEPDTTLNEKSKADIYEISLLETFIKDGKLSAKGEMILFSFLIALIIVTLILIFVMLRNFFKDRDKTKNINGQQDYEEETDHGEPQNILNIETQDVGEVGEDNIYFHKGRGYCFVTPQIESCPDADDERLSSVVGTEVESPPKRHPDIPSSPVVHIDYDDTGESDIDYIDIPRLFAK